MNQQQHIAQHPSDFIHPAASTEYGVNPGEQKFAIPTLLDGTAPKYLLLSSGHDTGYAVAVGDSTIDASAAPQFWLSEGVTGVILDVQGYTTISVDSAVTSALTTAPLGDF